MLGLTAAKRLLLFHRAYAQAQLWDCAMRADDGDDVSDRDAWIKLLNGNGDVGVEVDPNMHPLARVAGRQFDVDMQLCLKLRAQLRKDMGHSVQGKRS